MQQPVRFELTQLSPEQRARVIALLVQMILGQWSKRGEAKQNEPTQH